MAQFVRGRGNRAAVLSWLGTDVGAFAAVRLAVKSRKTDHVVLRKRFAFCVVCFKPALHNVDQDVHLVPVPVANSRMFIF